MDRSKKHVTGKDRLRVNNRIRAREVRLIGEDGSQIGVVSIREALHLAEEQNVDLVEVAPNASPPVCRLMDYGKFRYEQSKKEREARKHQKQTELKEVRLRPKTDIHDLEVKAKQARRFLQTGDKVKFTVRFRGREMAHINIGREILEQIIENLRDVATVEQKPTLEGKAISVVLVSSQKPGSSKPAGIRKTRSTGEPKGEEPRKENDPEKVSSHEDDAINDNDNDDLDNVVLDDDDLDDDLDDDDDFDDDDFDDDDNDS